MVCCFGKLPKKLCPALVLGSLLCGVTLAQVAQTVETAHLPGVDFSKYQTYRWVASKNQYPDPAVDAQIKQSFDAQLAARGLKQTNGTADLDVDYQTAISNQETWVAYEDWTETGLMEQRLPQRKQAIIEVGTLSIRMYDTAAKRLVWEGRAKKTLDPKSSSKDRQRNIDKATKKLLENYPPK